MCSRCWCICSKSKAHPDEVWMSPFLSGSHFNIIFAKHKWLFSCTMLQACKKVLICLCLWGLEVWRGSTVKQPYIWVCNLMSCACLFCISPFAYMHLKHNCKQVLGDHHSWNKNPRHLVATWKGWACLEMLILTTCLPSHRNFIAIEKPLT